MKIQEKLNKVLFGMLGSDALVTRWWDSPNHHWNLKSPNQVWEESENGKVEVIRYILSHAYR